MTTIKQITTCVIFISLALMVSCATAAERAIESKNKRFLEASFTEKKDKETFRVVIMSDSYEVVQTDNKETIQRDYDPGGDKYICDELKKHDRINEAREGMYHIALFPDRGTLRQVRPDKPLNLIELDNLVLDDLQRWTFKFPQKTIKPNNFFIKYRIVLRKKMTDEKIMKEVQKKMMGEE
jgi:hypothetical protein